MVNFGLHVWMFSFFLTSMLLVRLICYSVCLLPGAWTVLSCQWTWPPFLPALPAWFIFSVDFATGNNMWLITFFCVWPEAIFCDKKINYFSICFMWNLMQICLSVYTDWQKENGSHVAFHNYNFCYYKSSITNISKKTEKGHILSIQKDHVSVKGCDVAYVC